MKYDTLNEAALKAEIQKDFFSDYNYTVELGRIDFVVAAHNVESKNAILFSEETLLKSILWAEAKQGTTHDIYESFVQLILTIGKERTFEKYLPPKFIGAFDAEKIAFIEYYDVQSVFYQNDFNWNVTPSNHNSKEFKQLLEMSKSALEASSMMFYYEAQKEELKKFIALNFRAGADVTEKIAITKNNFTHVFMNWTKAVKPTIAVDWERVNRAGIISADFFLADLLSRDNESLKDNLFVVLQKTKYELARKIDEETGLFDSKKVGFSDGQKAHREFWAIYERPPKEEYWDEIIERRDLLVPQDIRERKGSFFTPQIWVEKSQQYLEEVLGENWQDENYIWDCCAGTGNLLNGLVNPRNVWASTLDKADVDVMKDRIANGWAMFENHVFQFDFLNDDFAKCPEELQEILNSTEKRKRLVIYINPPYAEAGRKKTVVSKGKNKANVSNNSLVWKKHSDLGLGIRELYVQFLTRIYDDISGCKIGQFSKLKIFEGTAFEKFRNFFCARLEKSFIVPANTFDNVSGNFPIGFFVWDTDIKEKFVETKIDAYDAAGKFLLQKTLSVACSKKITDWISSYDAKSSGKIIGYTGNKGPDIQNTSFLYISVVQKILPNGSLHNDTKYSINKDNLIQICIYLAVRWCITHTWLNDRDQFLYPSGDWESDKEFQLDCIVFTLFHGQNRISTDGGKINYWIPFTEQDVGSKKSFASDFMAKFLRDFKAGKISADKPQPPVPLLLEGEGGELATISNDAQNLPSPARRGSHGLFTKGGEVFSAQAAAVYSAGLELWRYYFETAGDSVNENASFYDIRKYFQGVDGKGRMNNKSGDVRCRTA